MCLESQLNGAHDARIGHEAPQIKTNQIIQIDFVIVKTETKYFLTWFLQLLMDDQNITCQARLM